MAWFRCIGNSGSSQLATVVLTNAQISTSDGNGSYLYPSYDDLINFDTVSVHVYATINNVYYENYVSVDCGRLPQQLTGVVLYDENGNTWSQSMNITFTRIAINQIAYSGSWENIYIDMVGFKEEGVQPIPAYKTLVYELQAGGQWESFTNPNVDLLSIEVTDSNGNVFSSYDFTSDSIASLEVYSSYTSLYPTFDSGKVLNIARTSDNATIYISVSNITSYHVKVYSLKYESSGSPVSHYASGTFITGSSTFAKVEVDCGFQPDYIEVDMDFGNNTHTCATYFKTSNNFESSYWDLRPMEGVRYEITLDRTEGETGISDITSTGFKYRCNASNTQNKACTYIAIKF